MLRIHKHYTRACYINSGVGDVEAHRKYVQDLVAERGWEYAELEGDLGMVRRLLSGEWDEESFLVLAPGEAARESFDEFVIAAGAVG